MLKYQSLRRRPYSAYCFSRLISIQQSLIANIYKGWVEKPKLVPKIQYALFGINSFTINKFHNVFLSMGFKARIQSILPSWRKKHVLQGGNKTPHVNISKHSASPIPNPGERIAFAKLIRELRSKDRKPDLAAQSHYRLDRDLGYFPNAKDLENSLQKHLFASSGPVRVLDKGAGSGRFATSLRDKVGADRNRLEITTVSLTRSITAENRPSINHERVGIGINMKHRHRFHLIIDFSGEDWRLPKDNLRQSILKSLSLLEKGGDLFTTIRLSQAPSEHIFTYGEFDKWSDQLFAKGTICSSKISFEEDGGSFAIVHFSV